MSRPNREPDFIDLDTVSRKGHSIDYYFEPEWTVYDGNDVVFCLGMMLNGEISYCTIGHGLEFNQHLPDFEKVQDAYKRFINKKIEEALLI